MGQLVKTGYATKDLIKPFVTISTNILGLINFIAPFFIAILITIGISQIKEKKIIFILKFLLIILITMIFVGILVTMLSSFLIPLIKFKVNTKGNLPINEYFIIPFPKLMLNISLGNNTLQVGSEIISILIGLIIGGFLKQGTKLYFYIDKIQQGFYFFFQKIIVPIIPLWIIGSFAQNTYISSGAMFFGSDILLTIIITVLQLGWLALMYSIVSYIKKYNFLNIYKAGLKIYGFLFTVGGNSSGPAIPYSIKRQDNLGYDNKKATVVSTTAFNMPGSLISIIVLSLFVLNVYSLNYSIYTFLGFVLVCILCLIIAPGVPGGPIGLVTPFLKTLLGFNPAMLAMFISLYYNQGTSNAGTNNASDLYITPWL